MSIEEKLTAHTAAMTENTAALLKVAGLLEISNAGREAAIAKITGAEGGEATTGTRGRKPKPTETPPAAETPKPAAEAPKEAAKPAGEPATADQVKAAALDLLKTAPDEATKAIFKGNLDAAKNHFGGENFMAAVPADRYADALTWIATWKADPKAKVNFDGDETGNSAGGGDDEFDIG